jgi:hypothetical protein
MPVQRGRLVVLAACAVLAGGLASHPARADEPPSAERLKAAAEEYDRGRRAFLADDFEGAAVHFENAFRDAPRAETLRLAIRARRKAKQLARAATLAAVAAQRYPNDTPTAQLVKETLDEARPQLGEYLIECASDCSIAADGRVASQSDTQKHRIFLDPGSHELGVSFKVGGSVAKHIDAKRGITENLVFETPPPPPVKVVPEPGGGNGGEGGGGGGAVPPPPTPKPLGPVVFFTAAGLTLALTGATVVSGIDAKNNPGVDAVRRACAGKDTSCPEYQSGKSAEVRTNILLGVTLGAAAVTGVIGLFFTQWSRPTSATAAQTVEVRLGAAPLPGGGSLGALGRF